MLLLLKESKHLGLNLLLASACHRTKKACIIRNGYSKPKITIVRVGFAIPQIVSISAAFLLLNSFLDAYPPSYWMHLLLMSPMKFKFLAMAFNLTICQWCLSSRIQALYIFSSLSFLLSTETLV